MTPLIILILWITYVCYASSAQSGHCSKDEGTDCSSQEFCSNSHNTDDFGSNLIKSLYSSIREAESNLANPGDYPAHYSPEEGEEFDFIVVGSGSAGSVVASRLSEKPMWRVLLLEAGGDPTPTMEIPGLFAALQKTQVDWQYQTDPGENNCLAMVNNSCNWPRGKVLGGSSAINGMLYVRANPQDYNSWAAAGNEGWDYHSVLHYFKKSEDMKARDVRSISDYKKFHGRHGYLSVDTWRNHGLKSLVDAYSAGMAEIGYKTNKDCNGKSQMGFVHLQGTIEDGKRCSSAKAFLRPAKNRENLKVSKHSLVSQVLIDKSSLSAYGVKFIDQHGKEITVKAKKEVILSAGAINSPQILMLSGIGPRKHLEEFGVEVLKDLPVGENLQDHQLMVGLLFSYNYTRHVRSFTEYMYEFLMSNSSRLSSLDMLSYVTFINTHDSKANYPDMQFHQFDYDPNNYLSLALTLKVLGIRDDIAKLYHEINSQRFISFVMPTLLQPLSRGKILLTSTNPTAKPKIISGYFTDDGTDMETFLKGVDFLASLASTEGMKNLDTKFHEISAPDCRKYPESSKEFRICSLKHFAATCYHPTSTCKMGPEEDPTSVVNPKLEVKGIQNLRVADASIMPNIVRGNTNAPSIMIGEKASDLVKEKWIHTTIINSH